VPGWHPVHGTDAHSVELKALLATPVAAAATALTGRPTPRWRARRMYLLDTPDLDLARSGVEIRLRRRVRGRYDVSARTRRCTSGAHDDADGTERAPPDGARVELDVLPGAVWRTVEMRREVEPGEALDAIVGAVPPAALLSVTQRTWARRGGRGPVSDEALADLRLHGPLVVARLQVPIPRGSGLRGARLEHCRYPSGREVLELSTRCPPEQARQVADALGRLVTDRGVALAETHRTKTAVWRDELTSD
jgi:hypothetical protein